MNTQLAPAQQFRVKLCIAAIIFGLAVSGITAFPFEIELGWLIQHCSGLPDIMQSWLSTIYNAIKTTNQTYPYLSYGTDWLAFAHLVLALLFIGPLKDPIKNIWIIEFGMVVCGLIFPLAFIAGGIRHIPVFWRFIDCSFGAIGIIPLAIAYRIIKKSTNNIKPYVSL
ncbi:hypothetical protein KXQ82_13150 [Mucilaginibacter sp. HMF5004]|uniref:hypothetical protein n=1 Tax=Mucilaginibacter rivuli TaxID=2857527 RepID=UPI001C5E7A03|nr:hypothetical protein [Mucilaginibacter rivuli]MBW4890676.1 hypothetical protein [Mucilaginibacter rivuli]